MPPLQFCIPPNPAVGTLRAHAELGLRKLRSGRNLAGILREVPAYAAATDTTTGMPVAANGQLSVPTARAVPPTAYRYAVLIARAKELVGQAAQIEMQYLNASERRDEAGYTLLKARQELTLASAQVRLQSLRVAEANDGVKLADLQIQRTLIQQQTYQAWIANGLNEYEQSMMDLYDDAANAQRAEAIASASVQTAQAITTAAAAQFGAAAAVASAASVGLFAAAGATAAVLGAGIQASIAKNSLLASQERRMDEWRLQAALSAQDLQIGAAEQSLAQDRVVIVEQEQTIAATQDTQARDTLEYLANRFTGFELWDWMSGVLGDVYRSLLQQAAAMLNVARAQLAFERQEQPPVTIRSDYWTVPSSSATAATGTDDRRGLTGSARLLADLYQLDQYAFDTDRRKLAVSKTLSLAQLAPADFQTFRETGVLVFSTPTELFDRDFPGQYLRLIRRIRTSVIALVPPVDGIKATLSSTGISRVVVGPEPFQPVTIRRDPETVALSVPIGGTGVFEGEQPAETMYLPFEGNGVDASWELRLPKASNRFDFSRLSDVLLTIDYTALQNYDYSRAVIGSLSARVRSEVAFSVRNDFPDAWYDLFNPDLLAEPDRGLLHLGVTRDDLPANLDSIRLDQVSLYLSGDAPVLKTFTVPGLSRTSPTGTTVAGGAARAIDGTISTRRGNGAAWLPLTAMAAGGEAPTPYGDWTLNLRTANPADAQALEEAIATGHLQDILLVLTYTAETPPWPA
jgi:receptor-binding and translocation channel-forming TcA subunit of Tc toxin